MKDRILEFLKAENKSSAQFADEIRVQPSGISHILSGRNNPSLDFVIKMLERYKYLSSDWLLFGKGNMYKSSGSSSMPGLFDQPDLNTEPPDITVTNQKTTDYPDNSGFGAEDIQKSLNPDSSVRIERIVIFYSDHSFEEYSAKSNNIHS